MPENEKQPLFDKKIINDSSPDGFSKPVQGCIFYKSYFYNSRMA